PRGVVERPAAPQPEAPQCPAERPGARSPGVEHPPDVDEQNDCDRHEDPEVDVDERRGEVDAAVVVADQRPEPEEDQHPEGQCPDDDVEWGGQQEALEPLRQRPAVATLGEHRLPPEECKRSERDDQDRSSAVVEDVPRDREVADPSDPVGEDPGHLTVNSMIWSFRSSSSASKTPVIVAGKTMRTVPPASTSLWRSYPWTRPSSATSEWTTIATFWPFFTVARWMPPTGLPPLISTRIVTGPAVV